MTDRTPTRRVENDDSESRRQQPTENVSADVAPELFGCGL
jgi:hypothetical protein